MVLVCLMTAVLAISTETQPPLDVELRDLQGRTATVWTDGEPLDVVMIVSARRLRNLKAWERHLRERFADLSYARIADVPETPRPTHEDVASKLRRRVPEDIRVFIDIERRWATELDLDTSHPNLLLLDKNGRLAASFEGRFDERLFEEVAAAIRALKDRT